MIVLPELGPLSATTPVSPLQPPRWGQETVLIPRDETWVSGSFLRPIRPSGVRLYVQRVKPTGGERQRVWPAPNTQRTSRRPWIVPS